MSSWGDLWREGEEERDIIRCHGRYSRCVAERAIQRYIELQKSRKWPYFGKFEDSHRGLGAWH